MDASSQSVGSRAKVTSCMLQPTQVVYARAVVFTFNSYICIGTEKTVNAESIPENCDCLTWPLPFVSLRLLLVFSKESDNFFIIVSV